MSDESTVGYVDDRHHVVNAGDGPHPTLTIHATKADSDAAEHDH